ncbi:hypothetical protein OA387_02195 [Prochlorococcus sp. AH-716-M10]|nr:hypothetical protein [Prochlorococcus sp. AH-716-M10]
MREESITERIKARSEILSTKFEIIDNPTLDNSKRGIKNCFYDFFARTQIISEE